MADVKMPDLKIVIAGAGGRMGAANIRAVTSLPGLALVGAVDRPGSAAIGRDAGSFAGIEALGVAISDDIDAAIANADAIIDFTAPAASVALAKKAAERRLVHIIGTTGCSEDDDSAIKASGRDGARIVKSGNFSMGVNLLASLVRKAAAALDQYDIEILEMHHARKVDAPSGTALLLGQAAAEGRAISLKDKSVRSRDGHTGPRETGTIGFATLRGGTVVGEHSVIFAGPSERLELVHRAEDRAIFAHGAARAALWARDQQPGFYSMADVLGLNSPKLHCTTFTGVSLLRKDTANDWHPDPRSPRGKRVEPQEPVHRLAQSRADRKRHRGSPRHRPGAQGQGHRARPLLHLGAAPGPAHAGPDAGRDGDRQRHHHPQYRAQ